MQPLVRVDNLKKHFTINKGFIKKKTIKVKAVDGVSFTINSGETLGLVGESGSGKTTLARIMLGLSQPTENTVYLDNEDIFKAGRKALKRIRSKMGVVFQDPAASLNPRSMIKQSLIRPLIINGLSKTEAEKTVINSLAEVNLGQELLTRYPHQLSGGQQQRVCVARAIGLRPELIILDEPTSALDVSVQAQILNLLLDLQAEYKLTYLFITHDLNVVRYISDRIAVMYLGKMMEIASTDDIFANPAHPYTKGLMSSSPVLSPTERDREKITFSGEPPSLIKLPTGCRLQPRCPYRHEDCLKKVPELSEVSAGHLTACYRANQFIEKNKEERM